MTQDQRRALALPDRTGAGHPGGVRGGGRPGRHGILTALHGIGREGLVEAVPVVAEVLGSVESPPGEAELRVRGFDARAAGLPFAAARACVRGGAGPPLRLLAEHGEQMLRLRRRRGVVELVESAPAGELDPGVRLTYADALRMCGDLTAAARAFRPLVDAAADPAGPGGRRRWPAGSRPSTTQAAGSKPPSTCWAQPSRPPAPTTRRASSGPHSGCTSCARSAATTRRARGGVRAPARRGVRRPARPHVGPPRDGAGQLRGA